MDYKNKIMTEVEALPESLLPELLSYVKTLQPKVAVTKSKLTIKPKSPSLSSVAGDTIIIYTDGACTGNPGKGGYGAVIIDGDRREELSAGYKLTTNNRMEMMGAIAALESLKSNSKVKLHSDSKYIVDAVVKGWAKKWQANGWRRNAKEMAKNPDLWQELLDLCKIHDVEFVWVKAHAGIAENEKCDRLAVAAAHGSNLITDQGYAG
ncbi:MAG: ribonuclease HI [Hyellaceae cyanobacterium CSU_1_1]|nr:ribonuclease HI [Hyellaceae cyanobacterium CSU_1_1]